MTLAIDGGTPVREAPFPAWPSFGPDEIGAVVNVLASGRVNYWTGDEGTQFEREFAAYTGCEHAVAVANGSVALELALHALDIGPGAEVIVPSRTFIASASCVALRGARPIFADVDAASQTLDAEDVARKLSARTRAIIAVHLAGWPCDMDALHALARPRGIAIIEDCAQAHGARYRGQPVGSLGDMAAFSFCRDKIMSTGGEGGMVTTRDRRLWERAWSYKDHGKSYDTVYHRQHPPGFRWLHESFGTNWRLTEMQAAIGRVLLRRLDAQVERRRSHARALAAALSDITLLRVETPPEIFHHSYYKFYAFIRPEYLAAEWSRDRIVEAICAEGVPAFSGSCSEVYLEKAFPESMRPASRLPVARQLGETSLMVLVHPTLTAADIADIAQAVEKVTQAALRLPRAASVSA